MATVQVVVTGGAGFIGSNLVRAILDDLESARIRVIDDLSTGLVENLPSSDRLDFVQGSILDQEFVDRALKGADSVVHLAARPSVPRSIKDPRTSHDTNASGTLNVLEAVRTTRSAHLIVASSSSVYGANEALPKSEDLTPMPVSPYAASKLATESYTLAWARTYGLPVLVFRFFNVFGPLQRADHDYAAAIPRFIDAVLSGKAIEIYGTGHQTRDFTYVGSLNRILVDALTRKVTHPNPVNAAFGNRTSLLEVIETLSRIAESKPDVIFRPARIGDVMHSQADAGQMLRLFPDCQPIDFEVGLRETFMWQRSVHS